MCNTCCCWTSNITMSTGRCCGCCWWVYCWRWWLRWRLFSRFIRIFNHFFFVYTCSHITTLRNSRKKAFLCSLTAATANFLDLITALASWTYLCVFARVNYAINIKEFVTVSKNIFRKLANKSHCSIQQEFLKYFRSAFN